MKKHLRFWLVVSLAFSLALPIYSVAQTKLILEDSNANRISTSAIKSFALGADNTLVIYLDQPFNFAALSPDISLDGTAGSYTNCTVSAPASVSAIQGVALTFKVTSSTANAAFLPLAVNPDEGVAVFDPATKTFAWNTSGVPMGSYLAVFQATAGTGGPTSQLVVMIRIIPPETVNPPTGLSPTGGSVNQAISFTATGASTSTGDSAEYRFSWGDPPAWSTWGSATQSHTYTTSGQFNVQVKARCSKDLVESTVYSATVTISNVSTYTITANPVNMPAGGSVSPSSVGNINSGGTATFSVTIPSGYSASVSEGSLSGTTGTVTWSISGVTTSHTANITFTQNAPPPANGQTLTWNARISTGVGAGYDVVYVGNQTNALATTLLVNVIGLTNETNVSFTWTFPDGKQFTGNAINTSINGILNLRTAKGFSPNLSEYDYIPTGNHVLKIHGNADSNLVVRAVAY